MGTGESRPRGEDCQVCGNFASRSDWQTQNARRYRNDNESRTGDTLPRVARTTGEPGQRTQDPRERPGGINPRHGVRHTRCRSWIAVALEQLANFADAEIDDGDGTPLRAGQMMFEVDSQCAINRGH